MTTQPTNEALIQMLESGARSNEIDVLVEVAVAHSQPVACRANEAGSKVIYTYRDGTEEVCWARDWSMEPLRSQAIKRLKAFLKKEAA